VLQEKPRGSSKKQPEQAEHTAFPELEWDFKIPGKSGCLEREAAWKQLPDQALSLGKSRQAARRVSAELASDVSTTDSEPGLVV
jgi:hypothetical protein